jgi:hypothetical protein
MPKNCGVIAIADSPLGHDPASKKALRRASGIWLVAYLTAKQAMVMSGGKRSCMSRTEGQAVIAVSRLSLVSARKLLELYRPIIFVKSGQGRSSQ